MTALPRRTTRALVVPAALLALLAGPAWAATTGAAAAAPRPAALDPGLGTSGSQPVKVVVSGRDGAAGQVRQAVLAAGGSALRSLPIVNGVAAAVPAAALAALAQAPGVTAVTKDRVVQLSAQGWDASQSASPYVWTSQAAQTWEATGTKGAGVGIAVLDTGVSAVQDLDGRLMPGPDLSGEGAHTVDSFGHGTMMAGIAAGDGAASAPRPRTGVAPAAHIVSVKVAGANGATDVSTVLAGLAWVGAFKDTYGIRVLNLSWGVPSTQDPLLDPLNFAVERLWNLGVVVVVAAGNAGPGPQTITKPADDPLVVTVGAYDDKADAVLGNDTSPDWSSQGPTAQGLAKPDLVAPGRTLVATRAPGSTIETANPGALVDAAYIKGSGTSEATAVTSGVAALILAAHPTWTPDMVKQALTSTATRIAGVPASRQGAGRIQAKAAVNALVTPVTALQVVPLATGLGSLQASRGAMVPVTVTCDGQPKTLDDETTSWCAPWSSASWSSASWSSASWSSASWSSASWSSSSWSSAAWTSASWSSASWSSASWSSASWSTANYSADDPAADSPDAFLTAFYGERPQWWQRVRGEISAPFRWRGLGL
jgi:serine protease AprX